VIFKTVLPHQMAKIIGIFNSKHFQVVYAKKNHNMQGCKISLGIIYQNSGEIYQMTTKLRNDPMLYHCIPFQGTRKYTQIGIFGMKMHVPSGNPAIMLQGPELRIRKHFVGGARGQRQREGALGFQRVRP
jgi:hypothetical protein